MSKCIGCGVKIQSIDPNEKGYVPAAALVNYGDEVYCKRCHDIMQHNYNYSENILPVLNDEKKVEEEVNKYYQALEKIKNKECLALLLLDVMDIYTGFIPNLSKYLQDNPVIIVINKSDIMPKSIKMSNIYDKVKELGITNNLNVKSIFYISSLKQKNIEDLMRRVMDYFKRKYHPGKDVYLLGTTSVGKSTFINTVLKMYNVTSKDLITTSNQHQTTLDYIKIPIGTNQTNETCYLIDTPGYINLKSITTYLSFSSLKKVTPSTYLKVRSYQIKGGQTLFLGGLVRIDIEGEVNVSCFVSNDLYIHRTKTVNALEIQNSQMFKLLTPPIDLDEQKRLGEYQTKEVALKCDEENMHWDLAIAGIGYIHFTGKEFKLSITSPKVISKVLVSNLI